MSESPSKKVQSLLVAAVERRGVAVKFVSALGHAIDRAFWISVATDRERDRLKADPTLAADFERIFSDTGYAALLEAQFDQDWNKPHFTNQVREEMAYLKRPGVEIESQESVDREQGGNWWHRMK